MYVESVFGIEAARRKIVEEVHKLISEQGIDVDIRHVMLIPIISTGEVCSSNT